MLHCLLHLNVRALIQRSRTSTLHLNSWTFKTLSAKRRQASASGRLQNRNTTSYWSIFVCPIVQVIDTWTRGIFRRPSLSWESQLVWSTQCVLFNDRPSLSRGLSIQKSWSLILGQQSRPPFRGKREQLVNLSVPNDSLMRSDTRIIVERRLQTHTHSNVQQSGYSEIGGQYWSLRYRWQAY